jgi:hypothetical protein
MFEALGIILAAYTAYAAIAGEVYAKSGLSLRKISRQESPAYFWTVISIYFALSIALILVF